MTKPKLNMAALRSELQVCQETLDEICASTGKVECVNETLRLIIKNCRNNGSKDQINLSVLCIRMLTILSRNCIPLDSQMLLSIAFCVTMSTGHSTQQAQTVLHTCLLWSDSSNQLEVEIDDESVQLMISNVDCFKLCLCHGMLQSRSATFLKSGLAMNSSDDEKHTDVCRTSLARAMLDVTLDCCGNYSRLTHLAFRVLTTWLLKVGQLGVLPKDTVFAKVFRVVCTNWDSPMSGIRDQNGKLLDLLLQVHGDQLEPLLTNVLHHQPWTVKSKYLVLAVLLPKFGVNQALTEFSDIALGLVSSLRQCHLVSAGCETYRACIGQMKESDWKTHFMPLVIDVLVRSETADCLELHNMFDYWMPYTFKKFSSVVKTLLSKLVPSPSLPVLYLIKLAQFNLNDTVLQVNLNDTVRDCSVRMITARDILVLAFQHSNETVRQLSFAIVCSSSKTSVVPSSDECELVFDFLTDNINSDSTPFRQNVYTSFTGFVKRLHDSSSAELKKSNGKWKEKKRKMHVARVNSEGVVSGLANSKTESRVNEAVDEKKACDVGISTFVSDFDKSQPEINQTPLESLTQFLERLHSFLVHNLEPGTNYQRKILSLRLYHLVLKTLTDTKGKKPFKTSHVYATGRGVLRYTSKESRHALLTCVLSPTEDIRETAASILIKHFSNTTSDFNAEISYRENVTLVDKSLQLCCSPMFYQTEGGALLLKVVSNWLYEQGQFSLLVQSFEPMADRNTILDLLIELATQQREVLQTSLFNAASSGPPVHGIITAITRIATETDGPEYSRMTEWNVERVLVFMEELVEHLLGVIASKSTGTTGFAPSFAEMGEAIESATHHQEAAHVQLSAAHQLLLNCVWLNFKACCVLATGLSCKPGMPLVTLQRCTQLIIKVLTRCRHKGAIESAGAALGRLVQAVSTGEHRALPGQLLNQFLDSHTGGASVTRRSAGLAILVHKIVINDQQPGKPLVILTVNRLISLASQPITSDDAVLSDLPQAQALHFLRTLLQDSSLRQHLAPCLSRVATLCFQSLASSIWTIRNAALQLYGAVVSKLAGQKKPLEDDIAGTAEEVSAHFPHLFLFLLSRLREATADPSLHPTLVPALSLLSKLTVKHPYLAQFSVTLHQPDANVLLAMRSSLLRLLSSRVYAVRKLAAKAVSGFTSFPEIRTTIVTLVKKLNAVDDSKRIGENQLNGILMTLKYLTERYRYDSVNMLRYNTQAMNVDDALRPLAEIEGVSFVNRALIAELKSFGVTASLNYNNCREICAEIVEANECADRSSCSVGLHHWANLRMKAVMNSCSEKDLFPCMISILSCDKEISDACIDVLNYRLSRKDFSTSVKSDIASSSFAILCSESFDYKPLILMELTLLICLQQDVDVRSSINDLNRFHNIYFESKRYGGKCYDVGLKLVCALTKTLVPFTSPADELYRFFTKVILLIESRGFPSSEEDHRINAAISLSILIKPLFKLLDTTEENRPIYRTVLDASIMMLQDENSLVRNTTSETASVIIHRLDLLAPNRTPIQRLLPHLCLRLLFTSKCWTALLGDKAALRLWCRLDYRRGLEKESEASRLVSPFDHGTTNIYAEEVRVVEWAADSLGEIVTTMGNKGRDDLLTILGAEETVRRRDAENILELSLKNVDDPAGIYLAAKQLCCQHDLLLSLGGEDNHGAIVQLRHYITQMGLVLGPQQ